MDRKIISLILLMSAIACTPALAKYGGGTGTEQDPYQIRDANHMQAIGADPNDWDKHFILIADIDLSQFDGKDGREPFNIIAPDTEQDEYQSFQGTPFTGVFDGNDHTISNFTHYSDDGIEYVGLFGYLEGSIKNLGLTDPNVFAYSNIVGSLVGRIAAGATITQCYANRGAVAGWVYVGGLVGGGSGTIIRCYASVTAEGLAYIGGLVGNCYGNISDSYATGSVRNLRGYDGIRGFGGLVGKFSHGYIVNCYATGREESNGDNIGGLIGEARCCVMAGRTDDSYWDIETTNQVWSACGLGAGCEGLTTVQMQQRASFTNWDFINVWNIGENQTYPYLRTHSASDINKDHITNFLDLCIVAEQWMTEE